MSFWHFQVMYDWFPESWPAMVKAGLAAEDYPPGWNNEDLSIKAMSQLCEGDLVLAAFKRHRFAGYGTLTSDFYRGGPSLNILSDRHGCLAFGERFNVRWTILPLDREPPYIDCHDLKAQGFDVDLLRGRCVKQIDEKTFRAVQARLDEAGAQPYVANGVTA